MSRHYVITCEHASPTIPAYIKNSDFICREALNDHFGWDPGAALVARQMAKKLNADFFRFDVTRLLIDGNRNPSIAMQQSALNHLSKSELARLRNDYESYRSSVHAKISELLCKETKLTFVSVHSFTPKFKSKLRPTDIGLLYRGFRPRHRMLAHNLRTAIQNKQVKTCHFKTAQVHFNRPYHGATDCLLNDLAYEFPKMDAMLFEVKHTLIDNKQKADEMGVLLSDSLISAGDLY